MKLGVFFDYSWNPESYEFGSVPNWKSLIPSLSATLVYDASSLLFSAIIGS